MAREDELVPSIPKYRREAENPRRAKDPLPKKDEGKKLNIAAYPRDPKWVSSMIQKYVPQETREKIQQGKRADTEAKSGRDWAMEQRAKDQPRDEDLYTSFEDIFNELSAKYGERVVGGGGIDTSPYDRAAQRAAAIYRQLENSFGPDAEALKSLFAQTAAEYQANADRARSSIQGAYADTNAERNRLLKALGIEQAGAIVGGNSAADEANVLSNIARALEASQSRNTGYQNSALTWNEQMKALSRLQGAEAQSAIQNAMAEAQARAAANTSTVGMSPSQLLTMSNSIMREQDKMNDALGADTGPNAASINALWDAAAARFPDDPAMQRAWVNSMKGTV